MKHFLPLVGILFVAASVSAATLIASPSTDGIEEMLRLPGPKRTEALANQPDSVYKILLKISENSEQSMDIRWRALTGAAMIRRERATPDLVKALESSDWYIRNAALVGLAEFSPPQALEAARHLVRDPALVVRSAAVEVLDKLGHDNDRTLLWQELAQSYNRRGSQSLWIRPQIVKVLSKNPQSSEQKKFTALLAEKDEAIRVAAAEGLDHMDRKPASK